MFGAKKKRRRRSEVRLGSQSGQYETTSTRPSLSLTPVLNFWQLRGAKVSGLVLLLLFSWAFYSLFTTPSFFVYGAEINGNLALSAREIYSAGGIDSQSIFWINPTHVADRVSALPNVKSATVSVAMPAQVTINIVERRPQLLWQTGNKSWWVDEEGTIVPPKADVEDMLKIIDDDMQPLEAGYKIDSAIVQGAQALRLLAPDVSVIRHTRAQGLIVSTQEGWPVFLGDGSEMRSKLVVLSVLLPELRAEEDPPMYIDLRNPQRPVYQLKPPIKIQPPPQQMQPRPQPRQLQPPVAPGFSGRQGRPLPNWPPRPAAPNG